jgi:hypothetical protein
MRIVDVVVGQKVLILDSCPDWDDWGRNKMPMRETEIVSLPRDLDSRVIVYRPKKYGGYSIGSHQECWRVDVQHLELLKPFKPVKPYPHTCKTCKKPARKIGKEALCSNVKCKSRRKLKLLKSMPLKFPDVNTDNVIICNECGLLPKLIYDGKLPENGRRFLCDNGHSRVRILQNGQKIKEGYVWYDNYFKPIRNRIKITITTT